jgi:hypothetical protein
LVARYAGGTAVSSYSGGLVATGILTPTPGFA